MLGLRILTPAARFGSTPLPKMSVMFSNIDSHDLPAITSLLNAISDPAVLLNLNYEICAANDAYRRTFAKGAPLPMKRTFCSVIVTRYRTTTAPPAIRLANTAPYASAWTPASASAFCIFTTPPVAANTSTWNSARSATTPATSPSLSQSCSQKVDNQAF